ncbi:hypothetical protein FOCC_FOCC017165 [Frankliniella occidentalis]|nr:hypothetical protein FOCC_FOCC017165 [Frankliniella occidentalis]
MMRLRHLLVKKIKLLFTGMKCFELYNHFPFPRCNVFFFLILRPLQSMLVSGMWTLLDATELRQQNLLKILTLENTGKIFLIAGNQPN